MSGTRCDPAVGLCAGCTWARTQPSAKGRVFWRCLRAQRDPAYLPYPPLPVLRCPGFEPLPEPDSAT